MKNRLRPLLSVALAFVAVSAASPVLAQAKPQDNKQTKQAKKQLDLAEAGLVDEAQATVLFTEALDSANVAIQAKADNPYGYLLAGRALVGLKRFDEADVALDKALELRKEYKGDIDPIREGAWFERYQTAQPLLESGDYKGAAVVLEGANSIYQERPEIMVVLGQIYVQEAQPDMAIERLKLADQVINTKAAGVDTSMARQWKEMQAEIPVTIAQAYITAKRYDEAATSLEALVKQFPENILYESNLASIYIEAKKPDMAKAVYARLAARPDLKPMDVYNIGIGYYQLEDYAGASGLFKKQWEMAPKDRDALEMWTRSVVLAATRGGAKATEAQLQELVTAAEAWVAIEPMSRVGLTLLTKALNDLNQTTKANEVFAKVSQMQVGLIDLQLARNPNGGGTVSGDLENVSAEPGKPVNLVFTFYDKAGTALGEKTLTVVTGAKETGRSPVNVPFVSDKAVDGYTYTMAVM